MDFGKKLFYPSTTKGMIALMKDYEAKYGRAMPITVEGKQWLYIRDDQIASTVSSHGPEIEF